MAEIGHLTLALGAFPERDFCGRGRIKVSRKGRYHPVFLLSFNGQSLADLRWNGPRRVRYTISGTSEHLDLTIGHMQRKIRAVDDDGRLSKIECSSPNGLARRDMQLLMYDGDNFILRRSQPDRWGACRFEVRKQHYLNNVLVFHFNPSDKSVPILIDVERLMRWEVAHFHRLLALVTTRIGLEYRMNGVH